MKCSRRSSGTSMQRGQGVPINGVNRKGLAEIVAHTRLRQRKHPSPTSRLFSVARELSVTASSREPWSVSIQTLASPSARRCSSPVFLRRDAQFRWSSVFRCCAHQGPDRDRVKRSGVPIRPGHLRTTCLIVSCSRHLVLARHTVKAPGSSCPPLLHLCAGEEKGARLQVNVIWSRSRGDVAPWGARRCALGLRNPVHP
jgi:hypothetical protein